MKIGDFLLCHKACKMNVTGEIVTTIGEEYEIIDIGGVNLMIIDDDNDDHLFPVDGFHSWFYDKKSLLNKKLNKVKNV